MAAEKGVRSVGGSIFCVSSSLKLPVLQCIETRAQIDDGIGGLGGGERGSKAGGGAGGVVRHGCPCGGACWAAEWPAETDFLRWPRISLAGRRM